MEEKKRNRREEYTLRTIRETFLTLLAKQSIERISVGELCELADINRSTFYRHYADVYALLDEICDECFNILFAEPVKHRSPGMEDPKRQMYNLILGACTVTEENKELFQLLLFKQPYARFSQRISDAFYQLQYDNFEKTHIRNPETNLHYQYMISGVLGIWQAWLKDDCALPKTIVAELAEQHMGSALRIVWSTHRQVPSSRIHNNV